MLLNTMCAEQPAPAVWEAVLLPAQGGGGNHAAEQTAQTCACRRGSAAGRAVLSARGIQLPSPAPMRTMARTAQRSPINEPCALPIAVALAKVEWQ